VKIVVLLNDTVELWLFVLIQNISKDKVKRIKIMVRILGNNLSNKKKIYIALTCIYGIGIPTSQKILKQLNIDPNIKVSELNDTNVSALRDILETDEFKLEGDLKRLVSLNIKRLIDINCFKGRRHLKGLPVRGQRTRTNNRTSRKLSLFTRK
jgi:small subunit ribosomal protein S13